MMFGLTALQLLYWLTLGMVAISAWLWGGREVREGIAIIALGSIASVAVTPQISVRFQHVELGILLIDVIVFFAFVRLALSSRRYWPLWATSFQGIGIVSHVANALLPTTLPAGYAIIQGFFAYPMMASILLGIFGHRQAMRAERAKPHSSQPS